MRRYGFSRIMAYDMGSEPISYSGPFGLWCPPGMKVLCRSQITAGDILHAGKHTLFAAVQGMPGGAYDLMALGTIASVAGEAADFVESDGATGGQANALRHLYGTCELTRRLGPDEARESQKLMRQRCRTMVIRIAKTAALIGPITGQPFEWRAIPGIREHLVKASPDKHSQLPQCPGSKMRRLIVAALLLAACAQDQEKTLVPSFALPPGFTGIEFGMTMEALESRRGVVVDSDQVYETVGQGYDVSYDFADHPLGPWERGALIRMQVNQFGLLADRAQAIHDSLGTVLKDHGAHVVLSTQYDRSPNAGSGARRSLTIWRTDSVDFAIDRGPSPGGGENVILRVQPRSVGITGLAPNPELADSIGGMSNDLGR